MLVLEEKKTLGFSPYPPPPKVFKEIPDGCYRDLQTGFITNVKPKKRYVKPIIKKETSMTFPQDILAAGFKIACKQCSGCHGCR